MKRLLLMTLTLALATIFSLAAVTAQEAAPAAPEMESIQDSPGSVSDGAGREVRSSPLVRRIAREHGISDLSMISARNCFPVSLNHFKACRQKK